MQENLLGKEYLGRYGTYPIMVFITQISLERSGYYLTSVHITRVDVSIESFYLDQKIAGVLLRFREEQVVVMGDMEAMFHQGNFPEDLCNFLKFLWWDNYDTNKDIID